MTLDADALSRLKVKDLQRELKKRGLDTGGLKAVLLQRLKEHLQQEENETEQKDKTPELSGKEESSNKKDPIDEDKEEKSDKKDEPAPKQNAGDNGGDKPETLKRRADAVDKDDDKDSPDVKKAKLTEKADTGSLQPEDEDGDKPASVVDAEKALDEDAEAREEEHRTTLRIDNFIRPFTLNAVKALVQELGNYVEDGFWMDAIKTHCFVTYPTSEIAKKTSAALNGKVWPPENGRSLRVKFADHSAMEVSQHGEENVPNRPKTKESNDTHATQRQKVTIDEFFQKTETKPVLYYLPLTDEEVQERKQRQSQQPEGQPRKRRHRGGRKRNRRARFRR
ncbi:RNSP1-SAP18 binding (RSB) motif [Phytophthora infestans]|uniref:RNSP1-SAP18 binding (RSB) motif n=1 Tax=Phytophthora infestans TaxID=4787 RepID=A0A833SVW4_PHYIN|nr:RNSP1-SAP18 binding (RSB) motif [Phytophthora infestans]KAF4132937.1 RNSP1-SAP18 binding (RSB) motif [Phytophthora infestans]